MNLALARIADPQGLLEAGGVIGTPVIGIAKTR